MSDAQLRLTGSVHCIPWKLSITSEWLGKSNFEAVIKFSKNFLTHYAWNLKYSRMCILRLSATSYCLQNFWHDMKLKHWEIFSNILVNCFMGYIWRWQLGNLMRCQFDKLSTRIDHEGIAMEFPNSRGFSIAYVVSLFVHRIVFNSFYSSMF